MLAAGLAALAAPAAAQSAGERLLEERHCTVCHAIDGKGGRSAPDLARRPARDFSPNVLAASLWNHAPAMWQAMRQRGLEPPAFTEPEMRDLFRFFLALRYFDPPGDAGRGKAAFSARTCDRCHGLREREGKPGPPAAAWTAAGDLTSWIEQMWNHAGRMAVEFERAGLRWPLLTDREMADLMVYLRHLPGARRDARPRVGEPALGAEIFAAQCAACHTLGADEAGKIGLAEREAGIRGMAGLAVSMWNHRPQMEQAARERNLELPRFESGQMADLIAYLFQSLYEPQPGDAGRGERAFTAKHCASCHPGREGSPGTAPELRGKRLGSADLAAAVWSHGPSMLAGMQSRGLAWPVLTGRDVADLLAFLARP